MARILSEGVGLRLEIVTDAFNSGLRVKNLGPQPAPWVKRGLELLEQGKPLTKEIIDGIDLEGGTDHPNPWD